MNRLLFRQRLNHLHEDALRFQNTLCAYETTDAVRYPGIFEKLGLDMAKGGKYCVQHKKYRKRFSDERQGTGTKLCRRGTGDYSERTALWIRSDSAAFDAKTKSSESYRISPGAANLRLKGIYCGASNLPFGVCSDLVYL